MNADPPRPASDQQPPQSAPPPTPVADLRTRRSLPLIWLVPIIAMLVAAYLGWRTLSQEGPAVTITFRTADGLTAGQTRVKHKAVDLGTVEQIELARDMSHVVVHVRMRNEAKPVLTDHAKFWVVRPRLSPGNFSGLETIVSGSFIELDPGLAGGATTDHFTGLEEPPQVRSDEPGRTFTLEAGRIGSLSTGSLMIYRDVPVGEVLGFDEVRPGQPVRIHAFVRAPYDEYVRDGSFFWNSSGVSITAGSQGVKLELESLQAVLAGAISFDTPPEALSTPVSKDGAEFKLFPDEATGAASHYDQHLPFLVHFKAPVGGLAPGARVTLYGIQVGTVTSVALNFDPVNHAVDVPVRFEVQPQRFMTGPPPSPQELMSSVQDLVKAGLRVQLHTDNIITGQQSISLGFFPEAAATAVTLEGSDIVLPTQPSEFDSISETVTALAGKIQKLPLDEIASNLNNTLAGVAKLANGPEMRNALASLSTTMTDVQDLVKRLDAGLTPALKRVPDIAAQLQGASEKVNRLAGSFDTGYGGNSEFSRNLARLLVQVNETARSVRLLADFLDQHPEALIRGRTGAATER